MPHSIDGYTSPRRAHPSFLEVADPPIIGDAWKKLSYRQRVDVWCKELARPAAVPLIMYVMYGVKIVLYLGAFHYFVRDRSQSAYSELNAKRFLLYNIAGDVLGFNSTNGPLGQRLRLPFVTWWNFLNRGTVTSPLLPGLPNTRGIHLIALYVVYVALLIWAMLQPEIGFSSVWPILLCLAIILPQDLTIFLASRGEHYIYFLFCAMFSSEEFLFGCQMVQAAIWTWAGISKIGPWFKYVNATMPLNSLLLRPFPAVLKMLHRDADYAMPSALCCWITYFATAMECSLGAACIYWLSLGVPLITKFHLYIFSMVPFASVMEWNIFCIWAGYWLFWFNTVSVPANLSPLLAAFLFVVLVVVPAVGQLFPKLVPFLIAYRPYAGNWRWCWHVVSKKASHKFKRLKTMDSVIHSENMSEMIKNEDYCQQADWMIAGGTVNFPHYRPLVPIVEELEELNQWGPDDYNCIAQEPLYNAIYGWCLGVGYHTKASHFDALRTICQFEKGECYVVTFEAMGLLNHTSEWSVVDIATWEKPVLTGSNPYHELETFGPTEAPRSLITRKAC